MGYKIFSLEKFDIYTNLKSVYANLRCILCHMEPNLIFVDAAYAIWIKRYET